MTTFSKNVLKLSTGNLVAQVISVGAVPIITRLYTPEEFGIFSIYLAIILVILPISALRLEVASMLPASNTESSALAATGILAVLAMVLLLALLIGVAEYSGVLHGFSLGTLVWLIPISLAVQGWAQVLSYRALREKRFSSMTKAVVTESVTDRVSVLTLGYFFPTGAGGLVAGRILGPLFSLLLLLRSVSYRAVFRHAKELRRDEWLATLRKYKNFPLISTLASLTNSASRELPVAVLAFYFSAPEAGFYSLAVRMMNLPMLLIGDAISKAYLQKASEDYSQQRDVGALSLRVFGYMVYIGMTPLIVLTFFGHDIFSFVFGERWGEAGDYTQILMGAFFGMFVYRVVSTLFDLLDYQRARIIFDSTMLVARLGSIALVASAGGRVIDALGILMVISLALYAMGMLFLFRSINITYHEISRELFYRVSVFLPLIVGFSTIKWFMNLQPSILVVAIGLLVVIQLIWAIYADPWLRIRAHQIIVATL